MSDLAHRLTAVREGIRSACRQAGRSSEEVRLVAVSKKQPDALLSDAFSAGQVDFGENYVQELQRKQAILPQARFHMIGHVQTNKAKGAAQAHLVHTLDSVRLARALVKAVGDGPPLGVLIEVNLAGEAQKAGVEPSLVEGLIDAVRELGSIEVRGLMCIPPSEGSRRWFAQLRTLAEALRERSGLTLPELSMGMSHDYTEAVLEGATMVRVGTAIFGPRPPADRAG